MIINKDAIYMPKMQREKPQNKKSVIMISLLNSAHNFQCQNSIPYSPYCVKFCTLKQQGLLDGLVLGKSHPLIFTSHLLSLQFALPFLVHNS